MIAKKKDNNLNVYIVSVAYFSTGRDIALLQDILCGQI